MVRLLLIACFCLWNVSSIAQHNHFVYVQSDNKQPFYVRLKDKLYSSSASGYVILPKLSAGQQALSFGFPNKEYPNQNITINISGKDLGYLLKNFPGKGWGLFNIQSMDIVMANGSSSGNVSAQTETRTDAFSNTLADVVNTPSIKEVEKNQPKQEIKPEPAKAEPVAKIEQTVQPVTVQPTITQSPAPTGVMSVVKKTGSSQSATSIAMQYFVTDEFGSDTVDVEIAVLPQIEAAVPVTVVTQDPKPEIKQAGSVPVESAKAGEPKFIDIDLPNPNADGKKEQQPSVADAPRPISAPTKSNSLEMINSDCKSMANESDFLKTRKKMTSQKSDDAMVESAKKLFKQKCYSTEQVRNLSVLFLKDESRYKFYDAVYPFVYDTKSFKQLESTLTEEYYISRFRSMIRN